MSFSTYAAYIDSGVDWLGEVPGHWELKRLKYVASLLTDKGDKRENAIGLENIEGWTGRFISTDAEFEGAGVDFDAGDVLFGKLRPYLAKVWLAEFDGEAVGDFHVMRPASDICGRYLVYQMLNRDFISIVDGSTFGAKMPRVGWDFMADMPMPLPPLPEQHAIATFLDRETSKIDALVAEQRRLIALLKEKRQAVISHAVTKGLNPDAPMKDSGIEWLGDVPEHWEVKPLKYLAAFRSGGTPSKAIPAYWHGDVPWASSKDLKSETLADTIDHITHFALDDGAATLVPARSILVVVRGMILLHSFPVVQCLVPMAINQDLKALTPLDSVHPSYLPWLIRGTTDATFGRIDEAAHGTKVLRMELWISIELPVPPVEEQDRIVANLKERLETLKQLQAEAERAITLLQERRTALISAAVTGKIDVREFAGEEAA